MSSQVANLTKLLDAGRDQQDQQNLHARRKGFFDKYQWWFVFLGLVGNLFFFLGSVCFLSKQLETPAMYLFIAGSCFMLVSSAAGSLAEYSRNQSD